MSSTPVKRDYSGTAVAAVILAAMVSGVVYRYWPSEERSIRRHLNNLAETLSLPYSDTEVVTITRFAAMREYFHPEVRIRIDDREILTRDVLIRLLSQWTPPPGGVTVEFSGIKITLAADRTTASVNLVASASAKEAANRERTIDARAFTIAMTKASGDWVIASAEGQPPN
jgi:hypothetical protein